MTTNRARMMQTALNVIRGERQGDVQAARIAFDLAVWVETRDLILNEQTTDEQLNAEIVAEIRAAAARRPVGGAE